MHVIDSIRERVRAPQPAASEFFLEAKREVMLLARQGHMMSPRDAWMLSGHTDGQETLWSVAYRVANKHDVEPEAICGFLEKQFSRFTHHATQKPTWDDIWY